MEIRKTTVLIMRQNEIKTTKDNILLFFFYYTDIHYYNDFTKQNKK